MLLTKGHVVFCGKTSHIVNYFTSISEEYACPSESNPADFYVDICSVDTRNKNVAHQSKSRVNQFIRIASETCNRSTLDSISVHTTVGAKNDNTVPIQRSSLVAWSAQFMALLKRFSQNNFRNPFYLLGSMFQGGQTKPGKVPRVNCVIVVYSAGRNSNYDSFLESQRFNTGRNSVQRIVDVSDCHC
jgi:hypothetical protein